MKKMLLVLSILCVTVFYRDANAYNIFLDRGSIPAQPASIAYGYNVSGWLTGLGHNVTVVDNYTNQNLSAYDIVLDLDYSSYYTLDNVQKNAYTSFLQGGGGLYLQGERPLGQYIAQDYAVIDYVNAIGGGQIQAIFNDDFYDPWHNKQHATVSAVTSNTNLTYNINRSLVVTDPGNGFFIAESDRRYANYMKEYNPTVPAHFEYGTFSNLLGFDYGDLTLAQNGRMVVSFDVSSFDPGQGWNENQYLFGEILSYLSAGPSVNPPIATPEPSTIVYFMCAGGIGLLALRKRKPGIKNG